MARSPMISPACISPREALPRGRGRLPKRRSSSRLLRQTQSSRLLGAGAPSVSQGATDAFQNDLDSTQANLTMVMRITWDRCLRQRSSGLRASPPWFVCAGAAREQMPTTRPAARETGDDFHGSSDVGSNALQIGGPSGVAGRGPGLRSRSFSSATAARSAWTACCTLVRSHANKIGAAAASPTPVVMSRADRQASAPGGTCFAAGGHARSFDPTPPPSSAATPPPPPSRLVDPPELAVHPEMTAACDVVRLALACSNVGIARPR